VTKVKTKSKSGKSKGTSEASMRKAVVMAARTMSARGLSPGRSGNVSVRWRDGMLITPTALAYDVMTTDDIVFVADDGDWSKSDLAPSSEWRFHQAAYRQRPDRHAVVHSHSLNATALACAHKPIPAFHYMVAVAGGRDIPCVPYATFGTDDLARHVAQGLAERDACLMANHGQIAIGPILDAALELAFEVETLATQYVAVLGLDAVHILSDEQMADMVERFKSYGKNRDG
jgi:L-fuculose-phosphate aldolase